LRNPHPRGGEGREETLIGLHLEASENQKRKSGKRVIKRGKRRGGRKGISLYGKGTLFIGLGKREKRVGDVGDFSVSNRCRRSSGACIGVQWERGWGKENLLGEVSSRSLGLVAKESRGTCTSGGRAAGRVGSVRNALWDYDPGKSGGKTLRLSGQEYQSEGEGIIQTSGRCGKKAASRREATLRGITKGGVWRWGGVET